MSAGTIRFASLAQEILQRGYSLRCCTLGSSMFPLLKTGSIIQVESVHPEDLRLGDVVVYLRPAQNGVVAHRLIRMQWGKGGLILITRGDSFPWNCREQIEPEQVLGRVVSVDWWPGLTLRIDSGLGRWLGLILPWMGFPLSWAYLPLRKVKERWPRWFQWLPGIKPQGGLTVPEGIVLSCEPPPPELSGLRLTAGGLHSIRKSFPNYYNQL